MWQCPWRPLKDAKFVSPVYLTKFPLMCHALSSDGLILVTQKESQSVILMIQLVGPMCTTPTHICQSTHASPCSLSIKQNTFLSLFCNAVCHGNHFVALIQKLGACAATVIGAVDRGVCPLPLFVTVSCFMLPHAMD